MKRPTISWLIAGLFALLLIPAQSATAQDNYLISDTSTMTVDGTSNIHDWTADVNAIEGKIQLADNSIQSVNVSIPVKSMDSGKGGMNSNMYEALQAKKHKNITFELTSAEAISGSWDSEQKISATGKLTIAGSTQNVTLEVTGSTTDSGYTFTGEKEINMTDYGVKPPTAMFGTVSTGEKVTIKFTIHTTVASNS